MKHWHCLVALADGSIDLRLVEATSSEEALNRITSRSLDVLSVTENGHASILRYLRTPLLARVRIGVHEQALLLTQLSMLVNSGLPVDRSLDLLGDQTSRSNARKIVTRMAITVKAGSGLASAFSEAGNFPPYVPGVIYASERSGKLGAALAALAERLTLSSATRRELLTALTYPAAIFAATLAALAIVLTVVVPQFQPIFAGQEGKLPSLTRTVLALSNAVTGEPWAMAAIVAGPPLSLVALFRSTPGRRVLEAYGHRVPLLGLRDQYLAAQFTGILATLLGNGVRIADALPLVRDAIGSRRWQVHAGAVEQRIREGSSLSAALAVDGLLPTTAIRLIEVGEKSGKLAETCAQASTIIGGAARSRIERIVALANPIAIITLGGMVAALVGGVMLGIFALGDFAG